ncbi:MAG: hypothetical protein ACO3KD_01395 [Gaiellales bacterium]|jgi:uncharacterized membrane protein
MAVAERDAPTALEHHRHRRGTPALTVGIVAAVALVLSGLSAAQGAWTVVLLALAPAAVALGWLGRRRFWIEDQVIDDRRVAVVRRDGSGGEIPLDRVVRVEVAAGGVRFTRDDGAVLDFGRTPHGRRILALMAAIRPEAERVERIDPACDT